MQALIKFFLGVIKNAKRIAVRKYECTGLICFKDNLGQGVRKVPVPLLALSEGLQGLFVLRDIDAVHGQVRDDALFVENRINAVLVPPPAELIFKLHGLFCFYDLEAHLPSEIRRLLGKIVFQGRSPKGLDGFAQTFGPPVVDRHNIAGQIQQKKPKRCVTQKLF